MSARVDGGIAARGRRTARVVYAMVLTMALAPVAAHAGGVALLKSSDLAVYQNTVEAFRRAYHGPVREFSLGDLTPEQAVRQIESANPEVVVAVGLRAAALIRDEMPRTPLVFCMVPSPARHDMVGARITGVSSDIPPALEIALLHAIAPDVRRVGVLVGKNSDAWVREAREAAEKLGLQLVDARVVSIDRLGPQLRTLLGDTDALWMPADADVATPEAFRLAMAEALAMRRPFLAFAPALVRAGALVAASPDLGWVGEKTADAVRRVQAGERASDVPVTPMRRVRMIANLSTAHALGREVPAIALKDAELVR